MKKLNLLLLTCIVSSTYGSESQSFSAPEGMSQYHAFMLLYNYAQPMGLGFLHAQPNISTAQEAKQIFTEKSWNGHCDYINGRAMHIDLKDMTKIHPRSYDRDYGIGKTKEILTSVSKEAIAAFNAQLMPDKEIQKQKNELSKTN